MSGFTFSGKGRFGDGGIKKSIIGILLQFFALAQGDFSKVKVQVIERKPFLKISLHGVTVKDADHQIDAIEKYIDEIVESFEEKMPKVAEEMAKLGERALTLQQEASGEIDAMNDFSKMQAMAKCVKYVSDVAKIPTYIKQCIKEIEMEVNEVKNLKTYLSQPGALEKLCADGQ